jgi:cytoskeleton protein RodZ
MTSAAVDAVARMAPAAPPPLAPVAPGAGDSAGAAAAPPTSAESSGHRLVARTSEPTWLRVQADGAEPVQELLPAGVTREWLAARKFVLTIGNAGGVQLELNGRAVPPLGTRGAVIRDLVLPREEPARPSP